MGDVFYIKARFYWKGKQREVQVGSIPNVLEIINRMISNNMLEGLKTVRAKKLTWNEIKKRSELMDGIRKIASLKSQEYILRKLMFNRVNILGTKDLVGVKQDDTPGIEGDYSQISANHKSETVEEAELEDGDNWYDRWRRDNL